MTRSAARLLLLALAASAGPGPGARLVTAAPLPPPVSTIDAAAAAVPIEAAALRHDAAATSRDAGATSRDAAAPGGSAGPQQAPEARVQEPLPVQDPTTDSAAARDTALADTLATGDASTLDAVPSGDAEPEAIANAPWSDTGTVLEPWQLLAIYLLAMALLATVAVFAYTRFLASRRPALEDDPDGEWPLPPLVIPARLATDGDRPADLHSPDPVATGTTRQPWANLTQPPMAGQASPRSRPILHAAAAAPVAVPDAAEQGEMVEAGPIRFHRPPDGTLQLLPGRFEILSGSERQEEIRFVRVAGQDAVVTFGRSEGEPHLHVQLRSRTVSRLHASIRFQEGRWYIANLSRTNPVVLNGQQMSGADAVHVALEDGDHIEMGEVVFRFRSR